MAKTTASKSASQRVGARIFLRESWAELRKVQWASRQSVIQGTIVVGIVTIFFAIYLTSVDYLAIRLVTEVEKLLT